MAEYSLICPFLNEDETYALGVEFGLLYSELKKLPETYQSYIQVGNQDQILLLASRFKYYVEEMNPWEDGWIFIKLRKE